MPVPLGHCLKRLPLRSFARFYAVAAAPETPADPVVKRRVRKVKPDTPPPLPTILEWTSVQEHLNQLAKTNGQLTLVDIERCRPPARPSEGSPGYKAAYNALFDKLCKSFTVKQLHEFLELYELPLPGKKNKKECVVAIMEKQWDWPSLSTIEAHEKDSQTSTEKFSLNPREAFLILGKDGADLRELSIKYNAHIEYQPNPLALVATGPIGSLQKLATHIEELRAAMSEDIFELPMHEPIQSHVFRRISRISGAFTQDFGSGKVRVSFNGNDPRTAVIARRLSARAISEGSYANKQQLFFHLPPSVASSSPVPVATTYPNIYSLYPFLSPHDLPWTAGASGVFRLRRVEEWFGKGASENLKKTGGLVMGRGHTITLQQQDVDLRDLLRAQVVPGTSRTVVASVGHVLLTSPPAQQMSIVPPLSGNFKLPEILDWMTGRPNPSLFIPSVPMSVLESQPSHHRMLHRLVYQAVVHSQNTLKVELDLQEPFRSTCWLGQSSKLDMMIPDRPADIRFTIFDSRVLSSPQCPPTMEDYITSLRSFLSYHVREATQPEPPLTFEHEGITYVLHSNSTVRQNTQQLGATDTPSLQVVTESVLDLDADQKSTSCQVICDNLDSEDTWGSFMSLCDEITTATAPVMSTPTQTSTPIH